MSSDFIASDFSIVPNAVLADRRLTLTHMRILIALLSFRRRNTDTVWPGRESLAERCGGIHLVNLSKALGELTDLGWLIKERAKDNYKKIEFRFVIPDLESTNSHLAESTNSYITEIFNRDIEHAAHEAKPPQPKKIESTGIGWDVPDKMFKGITPERMQAWERAFP